MKDKKEIKTGADEVHVVRDQQGKLYLANREPFGFFSLNGQPLLYGYRDLGTVQQAFVKLAQYQHAARVMRTQVQNQFLQALALLSEIEK